MTSLDINQVYNIRYVFSSVEQTSDLKSQINGKLTKVMSSKS